MSDRQSITHAERRKKFDETHQVAVEMIREQRVTRTAKTLRLRELRLAREAEIDTERVREREQSGKK